MTDEQSVETRFEEAARELLESRGYTQGILVDWFLITAQHVIDEEGDEATAMAVSNNSSQSIVKSLGLVQYAKINLENRIRN